MRRRREPWSFHDLVNRAGSVKMENFMQDRPTDRSKDSRLRLVFNNRVVAFRLGAHATMGDIAQAFHEHKSWHEGVPVAIDVRLACSSSLAAATTAPNPPLFLNS
jgi:hypothetical protein